MYDHFTNVYIISFYIVTSFAKSGKIHGHLNNNENTPASMRIFKAKYPIFVHILNYRIT